jgi:hypothetical protein
MHRLRRAPAPAARRLLRLLLLRIGALPAGAGGSDTILSTRGPALDLIAQITE